MWGFDYFFFLCVHKVVVGAQNWNVVTLDVRFLSMNQSLLAQLIIPSLTNLGTKKSQKQTLFTIAS
jgi:hypothetical protein